jgi:hypothetical protein
MCTNAEQQVGNLLVQEEPMVVNLLTELNIVNTPAGKAFIGEFDLAATDVQNWKSGTVATDVIEAVQDADAAFNTLSESIPVPPLYTGLANIIAAGLTVALSFVSGNSQPPGTTPGTVAAPSVMASHHKVTLETALATVKEKTGYTPTHWDMLRAQVDPHHVANIAKNHWNAEVDRISKQEGKSYDHLKV